MPGKQANCVKSDENCDIDQQEDCGGVIKRLNICKICRKVFSDHNKLKYHVKRCSLKRGKESLQENVRCLKSAESSGESDLAKDDVEKRLDKFKEQQDKICKHPNKSFDFLFE